MYLGELSRIGILSEPHPELLPRNDEEIGFGNGIILLFQHLLKKYRWYENRF
jgi:hypothetical protein